MPGKALRVTSFLAGFIGVLMASIGAHAVAGAPDLISSWNTATSFLFFHILN